MRSMRQTAVLGDLQHGVQVSFKRCEVEVVAGPDKGFARTFGQELIQIGSAPANDVLLTDPTVSRFHLKIQMRDGAFCVTDLSSTNGTYLGHYRVREAYLDNETVVTLGNTKIRFAPRSDQETVMVPRLDSMGGLIGSTPKMRQLYAVLERLARSDAPVVVLGETGTGKEMVARVLHEHSRRAEHPLEILDCTALPDNLAESELFGHTKGAFTGADRDRPGIFERADGGSVFLDELGELKLDLQPKLLRVLETGQVRRVGGDSAIRVNVRLIAATHRSLREMVNKGTFREDLYYRLSVCEVHLPPLRERREDIPRLVEHFLKRLESDNDIELPPEILQSFMKHEWPGNVRQLRNAVERAAIMGGDSLDTDLEPSSSIADSPPLPPASELSAAVDLSVPLKDAKAAFEHAYLLALLEAHGYDITQSATAADLHPKSLTRLLRRYGIVRKT